MGFAEKMGKGNHYRHEKVEEAVVSRVKGKGNVLLTGKNILSEGAQLESEAKLMAIAENDLVLNGAKESRDFEEFHKTKSGSVAKVTKISLDQQQSVTQVGTQVSGKDVVLSAGHDVKAKGIQAIAEDNLHIQAGHDVDIAADTNHFKNKRVETKKTSGVFTGGGIGITFGSKSEKHDYETEGWTQSDARSTLGSMNGNITVSAGNHTNVLGTDMITPRTNRIDIEGASVKVEAGKDIIESKEGHEYKQSGVTIALSTPVTDMAQAAYNSVKRAKQVSNSKLQALYAMKAGEEAFMAAQNVSKVAETLDALRAGNMQNTGTTSSPSVKISIGYGSQKQTQSSESQSISHQKSTVSTGTLNIKARDEKLTFEGVDANAKLMALSGKKGIEIKGVKDEEHQRTENKSVGGSVGVFVGTNGNSYGIGIEGSVNVAKGKSNSDSERWQNSHFTADKIITDSEEGGLTLDAANLKAKRWEADIQNLTVTSRQDTEKYESKQTGASASGSVAYGSGGGASVSASYSKAKVDYAQVKEQAGISVGEDGMDVTVHHHTQLNGAIIESDADASKNRFKTQSISTTDIENKSEIKTESASISAGTGGVNPMQALSSALSLLGNSHESEHSQTKSAISGNIQIETETPENLTALSRDAKNANQRVEKQDLQKVQERQEMAKVIGEISENAINIATYEAHEKINKLGLEKFKLEEQEKALQGQVGNEQQLAAIKQQLTSVQTEITKTQDEIDRTYGIGSEKGMAIRAVTAALQAAAQNDTAGSLVALASPYVNQTIHEMTAGDTAKDKATNLMAHALLSAVEFQVTGKDPLTGAIAGVTGEATAEIIARAYGKPISELTANEKENISTLSQLAGGLAAALTAKANGTTTEQGGSFLAETAGAETAKRAVENNFALETAVNNPQVDWTAEAKAQEKISEAERQAMEAFEKEHPGLIKKLKTTGDIASFVADLTPGIGDIKSFAEAEDGLDYALATVGLIPGADIVTKPLKAAKESIQKARAAEKLGNLAEAAKHQQEAARYIDNSVNGIYDSKEFRKAYEDVYGKANVRSTTVVENPRSTINNRTLSTGERLEVITSEKGKAVRITTKDEFGEIKEIANIPYDSRGLPIFDDVAKFTTSIKKPENYINSEIRRKKEMVNATLTLKAKILDGSINKSTFTDTQLEQIMKGKDKIDGFTWHHNAQSSPNNMQLVPTNIHDAVKHIGEGALSEGR